MININVKFAAATLFLMGSSWTISAQELSISHATVGSLETEITEALDGADISSVTKLTIFGESLDNTDATYLKTTFKDHLEELDITGITFIDNSVTDKLCQKMTTLKIVSLPTDLTKIGKYAFDGCLNLETVNWGLVENIDDYAFQNCAKLKLISLPENLTRIGQYGFSKCAEITISQLPDQLTGFGVRAFEFCSKLTINKIASSVTDIKERVFDRTGITDFTFSENIANIGNLAFFVEGNPTRTFTCRKETAPKLGDRSFGAASGISNTTVKVLKKYADSYTAWSTAGMTLDYLTHKVNISVKSNGTIEANGSGLVSENNSIEDGTTIEAYEGESITFTVTPAATVKLNGEEINPDEESQNSYTIAINEDDINLEIDFSVSTHIEKLDDTVTSCNVKQKILYITGKLTTPVIVFNCVGNQVISTQEPIIDLSLLPTGIYIVKANHQTFKIINK